MDIDMFDKITKGIFLEQCFIPKIISGHNRRGDTVIPLVGFTGLGELQNRDGKKSVWMNGQIISPNIIGNNGCACKSHIEGILTNQGNLRLIEVIYDFPAYEGDCFEFDLKRDYTNPKDISFRGESISRLGRNQDEPVKVGDIYLTLQHFNSGEEGNKKLMHSLPMHRQYNIIGLSTPRFWSTFLGEIEEQGYDHPYVAITSELEKERMKKSSHNLVPPPEISDEGEDIPF